MTGIGATKTLVEWSQDYTLLKISDDSIREFLPQSMGMRDTFIDVKVSD